MSTTNTVPSAMPEWAQSLSEKYYSRTLSMFVLFGSVRDLVRLNRGDTAEYVPLLAFLQQSLFGRRDLVLTYDRGGGLSFAHPDMQADFRNALSGYDSLAGVGRRTRPDRLSVHQSIDDGLSARRPPRTGSSHS